MFNIIGDWNPQLLREIKGQLKPLQIGVAIAIAIIGQIVFLVIMMGNFPSSFAPSHLVITTYPEIQLGYDTQNNTAPVTIQSLYYKTPLEDIPGNEFALEYSPLSPGDQIVASDGVPLVSNISGDTPHSRLTDTIIHPFANDWDNVKRLPYKPSPEVFKSANRLRKDVPGTFVTLTVKKHGIPSEIKLPRIVTSKQSNPYCLVSERWTDVSQATQQTGHFYQNACQVAPGQHTYRINWPRLHQESFWILNLATIFPLLILGSYSIINNVLKEERDGTLNFIRLSPRSAWEILGGKMLGVPALVYGAVLLTLPLNLIRGLMGGVPLGMLLSFYGATILLAFLSFSFAIFFGLIRMGIGVIQAWLGAGIIFLIQLACLQISRFAEDLGGSDLWAWGFLFSPFSILRSMGHEPFIDSSITDSYAAVDPSFSWFGIPIGPLMIGILMVVNGVVLGNWVWKALERRFFMPTGTIISKAQSYGLTLFFNMCLVGFSWQSVDSRKSFSTWGGHHLILFGLAQILLWMLLVIALAPQQQSLQDWARYRHRMPARLPANGLTKENAVSQDHVHEQQRLSMGKPLSLWADLVWGEKSPMGVAIALNLLMSLGFMLVWLLHHLLAVGEDQVWGWMLSTVVVFTAASLVMLMGATLAQFVFLYRQQYAVVIVAALLITVVVGPPIALSLLGVSESAAPHVWLLLFPWANVGRLIPDIALSLNMMLVGLTVLATQVGFLGGINWLLAQQFRTIGESDTKALLKGAQPQENY